MAIKFVAASLFSFTCSFSLLGQEFIVSPEMPVSRPAYGRSLRHASEPAVAHGGNQGLVVWNGGARLARVANDGTVIDVPALTRKSTAEEWLSADVVWATDHYAVPTITCSNCTLPPYGPWSPSLTMTTVGTDGTMGPLRKIADVEGTDVVAAASTSGMIAVVAGRTIEAFTFNASGALINRRLVAPDPAWPQRVSVASDGSTYLIVQSSDGRIRGTYVSATGELLPAQIDLAGNDASVTWSSFGYTIAYTTGDKEIHVQRVWQPQTEPAVYIAEREVLRPAITWDGAQYRIAWKEVAGDESLECHGILGDVGYQEQCAPVDAIAATIDTQGTLTNRTILGHAIDRHGRITTVDRLAIDHSLVAWSELQQDILARTDNAPEPVVVSSAAPNQEAPVVVRNGDDFIALWRETTDRTTLHLLRYSVRRERFGVAYTLTKSLDGSADASWNRTDTFVVWGERSEATGPEIKLAIAGENGRIWTTASIAPGLYPSIACSYSDCLFTWLADGHILAKRIGKDGSALDLSPIDVGGGYSPASVQWNGRSYVIKLSNKLVFMRDGSIVNRITLPNDRFTLGCGDEHCIAAFSNNILTVDDAGMITTLEEANTLSRIVWTGYSFVGLSMNACGTTATHLSRDGKPGSSMQISAGLPEGCDYDPVIAERDDGVGLIAYTRHPIDWDLPSAVVVRTIRDLRQ